MAQKNKVKLTEEEVKHVAKLANLNVSDSKLTSFEKNLSDIVGFVDKLQEVDTKGIEPTNQVTGLENVFREDVVTPSLTQEEALSNAPRKSKGYFLVDKIFE